MTNTQFRRLSEVIHSRATGFPTNFSNQDVIVPEKSPPRICYLYPESEDLPHYNPEKLVDATIDTKSQFIGFKLNSDSLEKLLQEALKGDLAPITEICSVDVYPIE